MIKQPHLSFFLDFTWLNTWWHTYAGENDHLYIVLLFEGDSLRAIAPFYIKDHTLRLIGTGEAEQEEVASEYLDIICSPQHFDVVGTALADVIMDCLFRHHQTSAPYCQKPTTQAKDIVLNNYLESSCLARFAKSMGRFFFHISRCVGTSYTCQLPASQDEFHQQLSPSFKKKLKRHQNQWRRANSGQWERYRYLSEFDQGFAHLSRLHQLRWQSQGKQGVFSEPRFVDFHQQFMRQALMNNWLELWVLFARGQAISAIYAITYNETCYFYQSGLDTDFKPNLSPGFLSHFLLIENCIERQIKYYDFMKGARENSYKQSFTNIKRDLFESRLVLKKASNLGFVMNNKLKQARDFLLWKNQ
ncbi:GNAT family N-acetyltransferase [Thalassotalea sp. PS06]|uniref:GNAT family N-acetyltransferase n=1 Tax=Thalassotalea sp. PS06 TaxID=2594005 RepID=UPI00163DC5AC|nr:GNAT family N-acetyltransferase [Thalassotalea sp. PS06]